MNHTIAVINDKALIEGLKVSIYNIPTDLPEADGTISWDSTTLVLVELEAGGKKGIGYTYGYPAVASIIYHTLKNIVVGKDAMQIAGINTEMIKAIRNNGTTGVAMMAVSAVDNALWDLKAKILDIPLASLLGKTSDTMPIYGSGGFTTYTNEQLERQLSGWMEMGIGAVKMKIGTQPDKDVARVRIARRAIGKETSLYVDANNAYSARQALEFAWKFREYDVTWFEEPVSFDNLDGLAFIRQQVPPEMQIASGEYGYNLPYFQSILAAKAVDVLQCDATRCGGISVFLKAGSLCEAYQHPFSSHCAPGLHLHAAVCLPAFTTAEYFHDHVRIERMLFDGLPPVKDGALAPDMSRPGIGLEFKYEDARKYKL